MALQDARRRTMEFRRRTHVATIAAVIIAAVGAAGANEFAKGGENNGCSAVKIAWGLQGLGSHMVPSSPLSGLYTTRLLIGLPVNLSYQIKQTPPLTAAIDIHLCDSGK